MREAVAFYSRLLGIPGDAVFEDLHYFDCGGVILALVGVAEPTPNAETVYFATGDLEAVHASVKELGSLSPAEVHGKSAGEIIERPWGERSFYANDPFGNQLCFVDETTTFLGRGEALSGPDEAGGV